MDPPNLPVSEKTALNRLKVDDDEGRLLALSRYDLLDSEEEEQFENIVALVRQILQVPICAVSLVDRHRQWFKARRGLPVRETPIEMSFCRYAIRDSVPFMVPDALEDPRFRNNALVTGEPFIRSYLGSPLRTPDGYNLGSLCAIDTKPRTFADHEISILNSFAKVVMDELELRQVASSDGLTSVLNRRAWMEAAGKEIKRRARNGSPLSLAIMDIDRFKSVNDTHGHQAGDLVIQALAALGMDTMRETDVFGRYGGEEFVLLMPEVGIDAARSAAERLRVGFERLPIAIEDGGPLSCTISLGVAEFTDQDTIETFLRRADRRLYEAKETGRNKVVGERA